MRQPRSVRLAENVAGLVRRILPPPLTRLVYRLGYRVITSWWLFFSWPRSNGSKVVVTRGDEVLFVRLTYGSRDTWDLPGGTANDDESPEATAARELYEEIGLSGELEFLGEWIISGHGRKGTLHGYRLELAPGVEPVLDDIEIAEARWFDRDDLPERIARGSDAIIEFAF